MKHIMKLLFGSIPDTVLISDSYGYLLDYNRTEPFEKIKKGVKLKNLIPGCFDSDIGVFRTGGSVYRRQTSPIAAEDGIAGYTVMLSDITAQTVLIEKRREKDGELKNLVAALRRSNQELEDLCLQVKELTDYAEQLRIARVIHDDAGHAITELHTISQMCLELRTSDPARYRELIREGIEICHRVLREEEAQEYESLKDLCERFVSVVQIPCNIRLSGEEPSFLREQYPLIAKILKEAYHNTLDHSYADEMTIETQFSENEVILRITDNGSFHGEFEKGFGLGIMEDSIVSSGGEVQFIAEEGKGFTILVKWGVESKECRTE